MKLKTRKKTVLMRFPTDRYNMNKQIDVIRATKFFPKVTIIRIGKYPSGLEFFKTKAK